MTNAPPKKTSPPLFAALRLDPDKVREGVWITHPETNDQLRVRRLWCREHVAAYGKAIADYDAEHGEKAHNTDDGAKHVEAVALATGVVADWRIDADPERSYDASAMAALLADPALVELASWLRMSAGCSPFLRWRREWSRDRADRWPLPIALPAPLG